MASVSSHSTFLDAARCFNGPARNCEALACCYVSCHACNLSRLALCQACLVDWQCPTCRSRRAMRTELLSQSTSSAPPPGATSTAALLRDASNPRLGIELFSYRSQQAEPDALAWSWCGIITSNIQPDEKGRLGCKPCWDYWLEVPIDPQHPITIA